MDIPNQPIPQSQRAAFVAMPFADRLEHVYSKVIKPVLNRYTIACRRGDEIRRIGIIINQIYEVIEKADIVVCELTEPNPNVYYELGLAHALKKHTILLSQNAATIPFDTKHLRVIQYEDSNTGLIDLRDELELFLVEGFPVSQPSPLERAKGAFPIELTGEERNAHKRALFSSSVEFQRFAVKLFGDHQDKELFGKIHSLATKDESNADLKRDAFTALFKIDPEKALPILLLDGLHGQTEFLVRERVVSLLANYPPNSPIKSEIVKEIEDRSPFDPQIKTLTDQLLVQLTDTSWGVRRAACEVLAAWGTKKQNVLKRLQDMLADPEPLVRLAAFEALERLHAR